MAFFDLGLEVPRNVSVIGFDDILMAAWPSFTLTTVRQRRNVMVRETIAPIDALHGTVRTVTNA